MKLFSLFALMVFTTVASAQELIKTYDGSIVRCENKVDVFAHKFSGIYRPVKTVSNKNIADIQVEFLKCVEEKGEFKFITDKSFESRTVNVDGVDYKITRKDVVLLAFNGAGELVDRKALVKNKNETYSASLNTIFTRYDNSPTGKKSLEVAVQSVFVLEEVATGRVIDRGYETLGSYRLIVK